MKPTVIAISVLSYFVGGLTTFAIIRWIGKGDPDLALLMGAILGIQVAAMLQYQQSDGTNSNGVKLLIANVLSVSTTVLGLALQIIWRAFPSPEISIPIAAIGTFVGPFVLFDTMWNAMAKKRPR